MSKKLISMLTVMAMMFTLILPAMAAEDEGFDLVDAIEKADSGIEIYLRGDVVLTEKLTISKDISINLNGHNITADFEDDYGAIYVRPGANLFLSGVGKVSSTKATTIGNYGYVIINGSTVECADEDYAALYNFYYDRDTFGTASISRDADINGNVWNCGRLEVDGAEIDCLDNSGDLTIINANIGQLYGRDGSDAPELDDKGTITLRDGSVTIGDAEITGPFDVWGDVDFTFTGNITCPDDTHGDGVFYARDNSLLTLDGTGTVNSVGNNNYSMAVWANGGDVIINGGTYTNVGAGADTHYDLIYAGSRAGNGGTVTINGGTFIAHTTKWTLNTNDSNGTITVKGGTFYKYNPSEVYTEPTQPKNFVAEGYEVKADDDYYVVSPSAETAFRQAMAQGGNVTLTEDIQLDAAVEVTNTVVLDLNGHNISMTENDTEGNGVFWVKAGGDLTINGEGEIDGVGGSDYTMAIWADGGKVTINGGTYTNVGSGEDTQYDLIYAKNGGYIEINGGEFISETPFWTLNKNDKTNGDIVVKGGKFYGYNPSVSNTENPTANFVAEGYEVKAEGEYYVVSPSAETAFRQAMAEGGNVTLEADLCITAPCVVDKTVTLDMNGFKIYNETDIWNTAKKDWSLISVQGGDLTITGEGTLDALENDCYAIDVRGGGTLTIENGTVIGNVSAVYVLEGTANIEGGEYSIKQKSTFDDERYTLNCLDANFRAGTADINVTGGTFNKYNPAISNSENPEAVFVAEGYEVKADGEYYVVSAIVIPEPPAPPVEDDDDDYTPVVKNETTAKDENGKAIETEKQADGSVVVDAGEGDQFTIDTPKGEDATVVIETEGKNYGLVAVIVNEDGTETVITDTIPTENGIQFTVKDGQTVKIVDNSQIFDDVKEGDWNHDAVTFAAARGIVNGVGDGKFEPGTAATRGMVMTMLARLSGEDTTGGENWYAKGMEWARENGISDGTNPTAEISREQLIVMLWRLEGSPKANGALNGFDDATDVSGWANDAMAWAVEKGLVQGNNGQLMPENNANRDQVAQILMNFILMR